MPVKECWEWALPCGKHCKGWFCTKCCAGGWNEMGKGCKLVVSEYLPQILINHKWGNDDFTVGRHSTAVSILTLCVLSTESLLWWRPVLFITPHSFYAEHERQKEMGKTWQLHAMLVPGQNHGPERNSGRIGKVGKVWMGSVGRKLRYRCGFLDQEGCTVCMHIQFWGESTL